MKGPSRSIGSNRLLHPRCIHPDRYLYNLLIDPHEEESVVRQVENQEEGANHKRNAEVDQVGSDLKLTPGERLQVILLVETESRVL